MVDTPVRERRAEILTAAEREFGEHGWSGARVERIASSAGVNKQLIFHYFDSKAGLFAAATRTLLERYEPRPAPMAGPVEELRLVLRAVESAARAIPGVVLHRSPRASADFPSSASDAADAWRERLRSRLVDAVTEGQRRGHFRDDLDPAAAADIALALAFGAATLDAAPDAAGFMVDHCAWR